MIQIIHDIKKEHKILNDALARYGASLKIQDIAQHDLRCIGVVTVESDLAKIKTVLQRASVDITVQVVPLDLEWIPNIYYMLVQRDNVGKALRLLKQCEISTQNLSDYLRHYAKRKFRTEKILTLLAVVFIIVFTIVIAFATIEVVRAKKWDVAIFLSLFTFVLLIMTIYLLWQIIKTR